MTKKLHSDRWSWCHLKKITFANIHFWAVFFYAIGLYLLSHSLPCTSLSWLLYLHHEVRNIMCVLLLCSFSRSFHLFRIPWDFCVSFRVFPSLYRSPWNSKLDWTEFVDNLSSTDIIILNLLIHEHEIFFTYLMPFKSSNGLQLSQ